MAEGGAVRSPTKQQMANDIAAKVVRTRPRRPAQSPEERVEYRFEERTDSRRNR
jgi:hypothetical protein